MVVVGLLHVGGDAVVELLLGEEVLLLPADVEVWVQVLVVVVAVVVQVLQPEHGMKGLAPEHRVHSFLYGTL